MQSTITTTVAATVAAMVFTAGLAPAAYTPEQACEAGKNIAAGKYNACLSKAEKAFVLNGNAERYGKTLVRCQEKLVALWAKVEATAQAAGGTCPSSGDQTPIGDFIDACVQSVATAVGGGTLGPDPVTCSSDLDTCNSSLGTCTGDLGTCGENLTTCSGSLETCDDSLTTCNGNYTRCSGDLGTCNGNLTTCDGNLSSTNADLGTCTGNLGTCNGDLGTCNGNLSTCSSSLSATNADLGTCTGSLGTCSGNLSSTNADLGICNGDLTACLNAPVCGNSVLEAGEDCEVADLNGATCATQLGFVGGTLACSTGCSFDTSGCYAMRFGASRDTIIDQQTGLEWEKKTTEKGSGTNYADPHDVDNTYQWSSTGTAPDGGMFTDFLAKLNAPTGVGSSSVTGPTVTGCYAGHCDWRLPTIEELMGVPWPAVSEFQPDAANPYWAASSYALDPDYAWVVGTGYGGVGADNKAFSKFVRAVRSGS